MINKIVHNVNIGKFFPNSSIITLKSKVVETLQDTIILQLLRPRISETHNIRKTESFQEHEFIGLETETNQE